MAGQVWVEDDTISKALAGLTGDMYSAKNAALYQKIAEEIAKSKQERQQSEEFWNAKKTLPGLIGGVQQAEAAPVPPDYQKNWATGATGGGALGSETVPVGGPAPLQAFSAPAEQDAVKAREARDQAIADARTKLTGGVSNVAGLAMKTTEDASKYYQQYGQGLNVIGMPAAGSAEEARRMAMINPTSFVPKEPVNPYDSKHQEPILERAAVGLTNTGALDATTAPLIKNMIESKYAPKTTMVETPTGPQPSTIQQPMTPRDQALYDAATKATAPAAAPASTAAQAAPVVPKSPAVVGGAPTAAVPTTETPAPAPAKAPAPFLSPQGNITLGGSLSPKPAQDAERRVATAVQTAMPERQKIESILDFRTDPKTGQVNINTANIPGYMASTIYKSPLGSFDIAQGAGQYLDTVEKGTDTTRAQDYYTAARAWVEPVLRLASGAAINQDEYRSYYAMFIPGPADSPQTAADKLLRMRQWETAVATSSNAAQAMEKMSQIAPGREDVERLRTVLREHPEALAKPFTQILDQDAALRGAGAGGGGATPAARSSADQEALSWANANPNDPRAAQIRARLGGP